MKTLFSYIWPQTKKVNSRHSGIVEVTVVDGCKMLDSANANYSYGSLQEILEFALEKIDLSAVKSTLLLGLGGGSVIQSLREKFDYQQAIVAVELDEVIISLAHEEFGISASNNLQIVQDDAFNFVQNCTTPFDLIIIDLFIDNTVPEQFYSEKFCESIIRLMNVNSFIIFNLGLNKTDKSKMTSVKNYFKSRKLFDVQIYEKVCKANTVLIVKTS